MKTIEERVVEIFADRFCTRCPKILYTTCDRKLPGCCRIPEVRCMHEVIMNTIVSERENLTRWNDPKEVLPSDSRWVLARVNCDIAPYRIARYFEEEKEVNAHWYVLNYPEAPIGFVIDWREIHE